MIVVEELDYELWKEMIKNEEITALYLYTPMCGTCQVASKMLQVVEHIVPHIPIGKCNINFSKEIAMDYQVESVPCLLISQHGKVVEKVYAFKSVQNLLEKFK